MTERERERIRCKTRPPLKLYPVQPIETVNSLSPPFSIPPSEFGSSHIASLSVRHTELLKHHHRPPTAHATTHHPRRAPSRLFDAIACLIHGIYSELEFLTALCARCTTATAPLPV